MEWQAMQQFNSVDPQYLNIERNEIPNLYHCSF
jgi:hypothetical protein